MILQGEKVSLRPIKESDFDSFFKWHSDIEIRFQTAMHPFPITERMEKEWFEKVINDISNKKVIFIVEEDSSKLPIGYFQLTDINYLNRNSMLGIVIGEKEWQRKGLGKEIMELGLEYGFKFLGLQKISLLVLEQNPIAVKLYESLGFTKEGLLKNHYFYNGKRENIIYMSKIYLEI
jgi:RimJ/RimL family protein N-acetyltransferase